MTPWKLLGVESVFKGYRAIVRKTFQHPRGHEVQVDILDVGDDANVIALTPEGRAVVGEQFRCGPQVVMSEIAGGIIDAGETPEQAAIRELAEELGYKPATIEYLGYVYRDGWRSGKSHSFIATDCTPLDAGQQLDGFEAIDVKLIEIAELLHNAKNGKMTDTASVLLAYDRLRQLEEKYETTN